MMYCERVEKFLKGLGYRVEYVNMVERFGADEENTMGGINYNNHWVVINERLLVNPKKMWLTLLHEAGHALAAYYADGDKSEDAAIEWGWYLAKFLNIRLSLTTWKEFNWESRFCSKEEARDKNHISAMAA